MFLKKIFAWAMIILGSLGLLEAVGSGAEDAISTIFGAVLMISSGGIIVDLIHKIENNSTE